MHACIHVVACGTVYLEWSEDNLRESALSFHVEPGKQIQVSRPCDRYLYPRSTILLSRGCNLKQDGMVDCETEPPRLDVVVNVFMRVLGRQKQVDLLRVSGQPGLHGETPSP